MGSARIRMPGLGRSPVRTCGLITRFPMLAPPINAQAEIRSSLPFRAPSGMTPELWLWLECQDIAQASRAGWILLSIVQTEDWIRTARGQLVLLFSV